MAPNRRLKQARELRGWSQARVAEIIGTDATTVSRWERGLFLPTPYFREKLCACFGKNAEELGLLDAMTEPHLHGVVGPEVYEGSGLSGQVPGRSEMFAVKPRSLPGDIDTFTYILQRSSQEQQAYMLWQHAYVYALQNQRTEAQRLGLASVSVFEQVRHPNAAVVRAWLHQQGLLSASSSSSGDSSQPSAIQRKKASRPWLRVGGASMFIMLVLVAGLVLSGITSNRSPSPTPGGVTYSPLAFGENRTPDRPVLTQHTSKPHASSRVLPVQPGAVQIMDKDHGLQVPSPTPSSQPTAITSSGGATAPSIMPTITPSRLNPHTCYTDGGGYRAGYSCMITLAVYGNTNETFSWQASSTGIPTKFNSLTGTLSTGQSFQDIVYIPTTCNQYGTLFFEFRSFSSTQTTTVSVSWGC